MSEIEQPAGEATETRSGFVALIGAPNAASPRCSTSSSAPRCRSSRTKCRRTRAIVRGHVSRAQTQIVFVDTPGIFNPKRRLDEAMVTTAWGGAKDADLVLVLIRCGARPERRRAGNPRRAQPVRQPKFLVLNKIDRVKRETLLALAAEANAKVQFEETFMVSALTARAATRFSTARQRACLWVHGSIPRIRFPICRCASWPPRSRAKNCSAPASGAALLVACRDREVGRAHGRIGAHRTGHLCRARKPEEDVLAPRARRSAPSASGAGEIAEIAEQPVHLSCS